MPLFHPYPTHAALASILIALIAVACSSSPDAPHSSPADDGILFDADAPTVAAEPGSDVQNAATIRVSASNLLIPDPAADDPPLGFSNSYDLQREIYSGLTRVTNDPSSPFQPELAARWDVDDSQRSYTFTLRRGLTFSDGSPLVAADFKWSWERALQTGSSRSAAALGNIRGAPAVTVGSETQLAGVRAIDDLTLEVELVDPDPYFPAKTAAVAASVLLQANVAKWTTDWTKWAQAHEVAPPATENIMPVGTGPFRLAQFEFGERYVLERNEHYHRGPVALQSVVIDVADRTPRGLDGFDDGALDIVLTYQQELDERHNDSVDGNLATTTRAPRLQYLAFNPDLPPYDDTNFRRALAAADAPTPLRRIDAPWNSTSNRNADPVQSAADALASSVYADRTSNLTLTFHEYLQGLQLQQFEDAASAWQRELGVDTRYAPVSKSEYDELLAAGMIELRLGHVSAQYPAPASIIEQLVELFPHAATETDSTSAAIRRMAQQASATVDQVTRNARYAELAQLLVDDALVVPLHWTTGDALWLVRSGFTGFDDPAYGGSRFAGVHTVAR